MADPQYDVPEDYKSGLKDVLKEAKEIYEQKKGLGYQTYAGPQIAGFSPDELAAMQGIAGLVGTGQQYFAPATALTLGQTQQFTPQMAAQYMSPYQQAVVDVEKREAVRQAQVPMQEVRAKAAGAGGYGGSRQAILEAENIRNLQQRLGDIQTKGSQAAYETGLRAFEAQKERERAAASGLAALGQAAPKQALTELTALSGIGEAQRGMTQAGLDIARQEFEQQQQYPYTTLGQYQSTLYGYPYQSTARYQPMAQPSSSQNLAGILGAVGKIAGPSGFGFFNTGGSIAYRSEGGLSGHIKNLQSAGMVGDTGVSEASPLGQDVSKAGLLAALGSLLQGQKNITAEKQELFKRQQEAAAKKMEELEKQRSPINYISDLLLGYAQATPGAGMGAQLAEASEFAGERRPDLVSAEYEIEKQLAEGRIGLEEAKLKEAELYYDSIADLVDSKGIDLADYNNIRKAIDDQLGIMYDENSKTYINTASGQPLTADENLKRARFIEEQVKNYTTPEALQSAIVGKASELVSGNNADSNDEVPEGSTIQIKKSGGILSMISEEYED